MSDAAFAGSIAAEAARLGITVDELRERLRQENIAARREPKPGDALPPSVPNLGVPAAMLRTDGASEAAARASLLGFVAPRTGMVVGVDLASGPSWGVVEIPGIGKRITGGRDELRLTLRTPPRTSKNHTTLGIKQSVAYKRYETWIRDTLRPYVAALQLPLPDQRVNVAAVFYYDGTEPDLHGLMQGLADALETDEKRDWAGVLTNDRLIAGWDGSRKVHDPIRPRVELTITPIGAQP